MGKAVRGRAATASVLFGTLASVLFGTLASVASAAESSLKLCSQSMLAGRTWQVVFPQPNAPTGYAVACPISISITGAVSADATRCSIGGANGTTSLIPPAGTLTIDGACKVTGAV